MRRYIPCFLAAAAIMLTGCSGRKNQSEAPAAPPEPTKSAPLKVGFITDTAGLSDRSFNETAWQGVQEAAQSIHMETRALESRTVTDYESNVRLMAQQGYDLIITMGYLYDDPVRRAAREFPNISFAIADGSVDGLPNVVSLQFREEEGSFLAGMLAAGMAPSGIIGFVGGQSIPIIKRFEVGYRAGAWYQNRKIKVLASYTGSWEDPGAGKEQALSQFERGAAVVFHAAGKTGLGVIEAARAKGPGHYAIGVDADQDNLAPGFVLTSMMKRMDVAVKEIIKDKAEGRFTNGIKRLGVREGGLQLSAMQHTRDKIPADLLKQIDEARAAIADGRIKPPADEEGWKRFTAAVSGAQ